MRPLLQRARNLGLRAAGNGARAARNGGLSAHQAELEQAFRARPRDLTLGQLKERIAELRKAQSAGYDARRARELLSLRHLAAARLIDAAKGDPQYVSPDPARLPGGDPPIEFRPEQLTPQSLRAGILRDGYVLVRGLVPRESALEFAREIDRAQVERDKARAGEVAEPGYYEEFIPEENFGGLEVRQWIRDGGGLLAADSPRLSGAMLELFHQAGVPELVSSYLGEPALISAHKTTLRKADPSIPGAWHQDGSFMGEVRSMNLWLALSRCGDEAPGLDILPRRVDFFLSTGTEGAELDWTISDDQVRQAADGVEVIRPIFEPGDALLFDDLLVHQTAADPSMSHPRFAIENWFFGASGFPQDYAPLSV